MHCNTLHGNVRFACHGASTSRLSRVEAVGVVAQYLQCQDAGGAGCRPIQVAACRWITAGELTESLIHPFPCRQIHGNVFAGENLDRSSLRGR